MFLVILLNKASIYDSGLIVRPSATLEKPRRIFVNSMSDLFHRDIPEDYIRQVFDTMARADWHIFQVLTKRSACLAKLEPTLPWPSHIWVGVSVETIQYRWRVDHLRQVRARIRFISAERLLGSLADLNIQNVLRLTQTYKSACCSEEETIFYVGTFCPMDKMFQHKRVKYHSAEGEISTFA